MDNSKKRLFASFAVLTFTLCVFAGIAFADDDAEVDAVGFGADFTVNLGNVTMTAGETKTIDLDAALSEVYENPRTNWGTTASRATLANSDYSGLPSWMSVATSPNGSLPGSDLSNLNATITLTPTSAQSSQTYEFDMQFNLTYGMNIVYARFACSINVEVEDAGTPVTSVSISGGISGTVGGTITLTATTSPTGADDRHVTWSITSGSNYASISSTTNTTSGGTCKLSLNGAGSVTVRADAADGKGAYDTHTITITEQKITSLSISAGSGGSSITLTAKYSPSTANPDLTWEIISGDSSGYLSSYSGSSTTVYPDSYGRMQIRVTDEISGRTATDYIYVFEMAFNANGGSSAPSSILAIDDLSTYRIDIPSSEPYRSGWEFMGWSTSSGGSPSYEYGDDYSCSYSSLRTMYAIWGDYGYLTFNKNGGSGSVPSQQSLLIQEDDYDYITIPSSPTPTMSGMEFVGWCTNSSGTGTIYYPGDDVDVDCGDTVTLYAIFEDPYETFTLTYNANGGYGAPSRDEGESRTGSYTFTLDASTIPTNGAFTFLGWCADSNGSGTIYQPGSNFTTSDTNDTVYAIWQASYTLTYVGGPGATNVPGTQTHEAISTSAYSFTISSQTPTLTGSIFKGWDTSSQATTAVYQPGGSVSVDCNATVTLYAVWETAQIEITTTQGNEVVNMGESFSYTVGTSVSGCTISVSGADWLSVSGNTVSGTPSGPGTYTVTITASLNGYTSDTQQFQITVYSQMGFNSSPSASGIYAYVGD